MFKIGSALAATREHGNGLLYIRLNPHSYFKEGTHFDPSLDTVHVKLLEVLNDLKEGKIKVKKNETNLIYEIFRDSVVYVYS